MDTHVAIRIAVALYLVGALAVFFHLVADKIAFVRRGKAEDRGDHVGRRIGLFFTEVIGQRRVLERAAAGWAHALIFWGFLAFVVSTLDLLWRLAAGGGGFLRGPLAFFPWVVDGFAFLILSGILVLAIRRYGVRPAYLTYHSHESGIVLGVIAVIALTHFGERFLAGGMAEYSGYAHLVVAFSFLAYVPTSKHFHILGAPVNAVVKQLEGHQKMDYLDLEADLDESKGDAYGFNTLNHFAWTDRLSVLTCIECGRCQEACPAAATGKLLSPRDFIVDLKYHAKGKTPLGTQAAVARESFVASGASVEGIPREAQPLIDHVIAQRTLWECTTCMACVAACPVDIDHLSMLLNMRRYQVLDAGDIEPAYQRVFTNLERAGDPWGYGEHRKGETLRKLGDVPVARPGEEFEVLFWVGCWGLYDDRSAETTKATLKVLDHFGVDYRILGDSEVCCGENARRMGNELLFQMSAQTNLELFGTVKFRRLMVTNPHCHQVFGKDYRDFVPEGWDGLPFAVVSVEQEVARLVRERGLPAKAALGAVAYHDSCMYGRYNGIYEEQRTLVKGSGGDLVELSRHREHAFCCGAGGGNFWREEPEPRVSWNRAAEVMESGATTLAVSCPFCLAMLEDGLKVQKGFEERPVRVRHVVELVAEAIGATETRP